MTLNRAWVLAQRPEGAVRASDFAYREESFDPPTLQEGDILVRTRIISCAPTIRNWLNPPERSYRGAIGIGDPIRGMAAVEVLASRHGRFEAGQWALAVAPWQDYAVLRPDEAAVPITLIAAGMEAIAGCAPSQRLHLIFPRLSNLEGVEEGICQGMVEQETLDDWFRQEVLPLEPSIKDFFRRNWRVEDDVTDLTHDVYELAYSAARRGLPSTTRQYIFTVARNHLINKARRAQIVSFELVADLETLDSGVDAFAAERTLIARDLIRHVQAGLDKMTPRIREIIWLRKVEGLNVAESAARLGIGKDAVNHQLMMGMKALADHMLGGQGKITRRRYPARKHRDAS